MFQRCDIRFPVWKEESYMEWCFSSFKINACTSAVSGNWARMALLSWRSSKSSGLSSIVSSSCQSEGGGGSGGGFRCPCVSLQVYEGPACENKALTNGFQFLRACDVGAGFAGE